MLSMKPPPAAAPANPAQGEALKALGRHFSPEVREAFTRFSATRHPADADTVVLAIVLDHVPDKKRRPQTPPGDAVALMADLGFDSVAITEMVFFLEDLFQLRIANEEILRVRTVGDLRDFVRRKLAGQPVADPAARA